MTNQPTKNVASQNGLPRHLEENDQHNPDQEIEMKDCQTKKMDISEIQPHEWFLALTIFTEFIRESIFDETWCKQPVSSYHLTPNADVANLFDGYGEWILGISAEEADLRGAEQSARAGATPCEVRWWVRWRYQENSKEMPPDDYLDGVVYRVFHKLFIEGIRDGKFECLDRLACELCDVIVNEGQNRHDKGEKSWLERIECRRVQRQRSKTDST
jgi:hypothetical protein